MVRKRIVRIALAPIKYFDLSKKDNLVKVMEYIIEYFTALIEKFGEVLMSIS